MVAINKVILVGPVYQVKTIETQSGKDMITFTVKTWRPGRKKEDGSRGDDIKSWHNVVAYGGAARVLREHLTDGKVLYVEGVIDYYKDKNDVLRVQIILENFTFTGDN
jgi:single-stranded DNA-binding protein